MDQQATIVNKFTAWLHIYAPVFFAMLCPSQVTHVTEAHWNMAYVPECVGALALLQVVDIVALFLVSL